MRNPTSRAWPCRPEASDPRTPASHPRRQDEVPRSPHRPRQARYPRPPASQGSCRHRGQGLSGLGMAGRGRLGGEGHSPERLGIGHCSRPVNVQVSAAAGRGRGGHLRTGCRRPTPAVFQPFPTLPQWQLWPSIPGWPQSWGFTVTELSQLWKRPSQIPVRGQQGGADRLCTNRGLQATPHA